MPLSPHLIDTDKLPADAKDAVMEVAIKHNALVKDTSGMHRDLYGLAGNTSEAVAETKTILTTLRFGWHWIKVKGIAPTLMATALVYLLHMLGVPTQGVFKLVVGVLSQGGTP